MSYDNNNIFAKILKGKAKAKIVYENDHALCFEDIFPKTKIHILIIPKNEYTDIYDFSRNASSKEKESIFLAFEALIDLYELDKRGCRIITNHGVDGRQEVPHLHFHFLGGQDVGRMTNI